MMLTMSTFIGDTVDTSIALMVVFMLGIAQIVCYKYDWKPRIDQTSIARKRTKITILLIITIFLSNILALIFRLSFHYVWPNCSICNNGYIIGRLLFVTIRCLNRLFFIQRAKLSQEIKPTIDTKYFDKILPSLVICLYSIFAIAIVSISITDSINHHNKYECIHLESIHTNYIEYHQCLQDTNNDNISIVYIGSTLVAFATNIVIAFLFLKPMCLIPSIPNSVFSNCKQTRKQYKTILMYNLILSMINLFFSQFMVSIWSLYPETFWYIPSIDNMINALTTYLMIGRNRQWSKKIYYYIIEKLCCKRCVFSHQDVAITRLSKDTNGTSHSSVDGVEYPIEMVHGDVNKIRTYGASITPRVTPKKQRLSTFVSEVELRWKSSDELYRERQRTSGTNGHQYTASDNANLAQYNLTTHIRKLQTVETATENISDARLVSSYTETQKDIVTNVEMDEDYVSAYHNNLKAIKARPSEVEFENDDAGSYEVMITKLLTMEEDDDVI